MGQEICPSASEQQYGKSGSLVVNSATSDLNRTAAGVAASPTVSLHVQKGSQQADQAPPSTILTLLVSPF